MRAQHLPLGALLVLCALAGCDGESGKPGAPPSSVDGFVAAMTKAGLAPGKLVPLADEDVGGAKCRRGDVGGVETTVCEFDDASRAKRHEGEGLDLVGDATGAALAEGKLLLVVADRRGVDKDGKRIDAITRAFRGR